MPSFEIICLANSIKHGGRCIAGLKTDASGWLRPISTTRDGTLYEEHYTLEDGSEPQLFDVLRIECTQPYPSCHQPENWVINDRRQWQRLGKPDLALLRRVINPEVMQHRAAKTLLGNTDAKIAYDILQTRPIAASLALIKPKSLSWRIIDIKQSKKIKSCFKLGNSCYNLPVTDPIWRKQLESLEVGEYTAMEVINQLALQHFEPDQFLLTISLSEPFDDSCCYKLVAAVTNINVIKHELGI